MRYNLGYMDKYPIEAAGSNIENNPMYRIVFKQTIDPIKLENAFLCAMKTFPLFKTQVLFDKEYFLQTNDKPLRLKRVSEDDRPKTFGKNTNGYPWQCCYSENKLTFEWLHGVSDGVGALNFLKEMLCCYFGVENNTPTYKFLVASGLEPFFDRKEKGKNYRVDPDGFSFKKFNKIENRGYQTDSYELVCNTSDILKLSKDVDSSISLVLTILFSKAIRMHLPSDLKNKNVACNVVMDLRRPLNYETMHNCVEYKRITYQDKHESMSFREVAREYKRILDNGRLVPNIVRAITERVTTFKLYHILPNKKFLKFCVKMVGLILKDLDCNFVVTYPGKIDLPKEVMQKIDNIDFKVWHDFGECIIACVDYNGRFNVNISENFAEKGIVEDFMRLSDNVGVHFKLQKTGIFEQAHFEE